MKTGLIFAALIAAASGAANADPRDEALAAMTRCSTLGDRDKRLGCYDATISRAPVAPVAMAPLASSPVVTASASPPPRPRTSGFMASLFGAGGPKRAVQTTPAQFGSESIANGGANALPIPLDGDTIDQISARLTAVSFEAGLVTVTLDNGQVWRQTAGVDAVGSLSRPPGSYVATIARGSFAGSYAMRLSGRAGVIPVRRIR
jgi:hypothetical protein